MIVLVKFDRDAKLKMKAIEKELNNAAEGIVGEMATILKLLPSQRWIKILVKAFKTNLHRLYQLWHEPSQKGDSNGAALNELLSG